MDYDQFRAEYDPIFDVLDAEKLPDWLPAAIARLKQLAATIDDPADRRSAENDIAMIESVLSAGADEQPYSPAMIEAERVHALANADDGTDEERIARAEAGMAEISRIAQTADPSERTAILELNESLYMLILALQPVSTSSAGG